MTVIPFEILGPADREYFATGIADEISTRLRGVPGISVIARQSAAAYRNTEKSPQEIGEELGIAYYLTSILRFITHWLFLTTLPKR